ncbi:MAG: PTS transporter subunit EIIC [Erysipelotrichaceae bacterium]
MKKKLYDATQKFSQTVVLPVMFMSVTGLILSLGIILSMDGMPTILQAIGGVFYGLMYEIGITQLPLIFCVGIAVGLSRKKKTEAALLAVMSFILFLSANNMYLAMMGKLVEGSLAGSGQAILLGFQVVDMGVFIGIIIGVVTGVVFNKYCDTKFPDVVSVYGGSRFVLFLLILINIGLAILFGEVWPIVNNGILALGNFINESGNFGLFTYGFLNRFLIPTGMHHLIYMPFMFTSVGGAVQIGGEMVYGASNILLSEMGDLANITALSESVKYMMFGFAKTFGSIGVTMAFINTAKPEHKKRVKAILIPLLMVALMAGITEPLEFTFAFISPVLWLAYSVLDGLFQVIIFALGSRLAMTGGLLKVLPTLFSIPMGLTKAYITFGVGLLSIPVWYYTFKFLIVKLKLRTIADQEENVDSVQTTPSVSQETSDVQCIVDGLGGVENIVSVTNCFTRLRVEVLDVNKINDAKINEFPNSGIVKKNNNIQIIIGMKVGDVKDRVVKITGGE